MQRRKSVGSIDIRISTKNIYKKKGKKRNCKKGKININKKSFSSLTSHALESVIISMIIQRNKIIHIRKTCTTTRCRVEGE